MEGNSGLLHSFLTPVQPFCSPSPRPQNRCVRSGCAGEGAQRLLLFDFIFFLNIDGGGGEVSKPRQRCAVRTGRFPPRRPVKTRGGSQHAGVAMRIPPGLPSAPAELLRSFSRSRCTARLGEQPACTPQPYGGCVAEQSAALLRAPPRPAAHSPPQRPARTPAPCACVRRGGYPNFPPHPPPRTPHPSHPPDPRKSADPRTYPRGAERGPIRARRGAGMALAAGAERAPDPAGAALARGRRGARRAPSSRGGSG